VDISDNEIKKALITVSIEQVLLDIGRPVFEAVTRNLYNRYKCYIPDCYEHPEYLKSVLQDLYGDAYHVIIQSIWKYLDEFVSDRSIRKFVKVLVN
jgi:hypothetical protein